MPNKEGEETNISRHSLLFEPHIPWLRRGHITYKKHATLQQQPSSFMDSIWGLRCMRKGEKNCTSSGSGLEAETSCCNEWWICAKILHTAYRRRRGLQRNSASKAMWSDDHSGEGNAVSLRKLSSSTNSKSDSTLSESAAKNHNSNTINIMQFGCLPTTNSKAQPYHGCLCDETKPTAREFSLSLQTDIIQNLQEWT
jgi:hypothetical protein